MTAHVAPAGGATRAARSVARWFRDLRCAPTENGHGLASTPKAVTGNELVFPLPGGPATTIIRARITQRHPVSSVVSESGNISGGSSLDTSLPSASTIPKRSKRAREPCCAQLREAPAPLDAILLAIEVEIIETRFGNRC